MAKIAAGKTKKKLKRKAFIAELELPQRINYIIMLGGVLVVLLGYIVMSMGDDISPLSVTVAPIILTIGYCVIIPLGILYRRRSKTAEPV
jgi:pilus assembly protein TadC